MALVKIGQFPVRYRDPRLKGDPFSEFMVGDVVVWVDPEGLARKLGPRAMKAKGRQAVEASGLVVVAQVL